MNQFTGFQFNLAYFKSLLIIFNGCTHQLNHKSKVIKAKLNFKERFCELKQSLYIFCLFIQVFIWLIFFEKKLMRRISINVTSFLSIPCLRDIGIADHSFGPLSDLTHGITENGLRHASGPVHAQHPIRYIHNPWIFC